MTDAVRNTEELRRIVALPRRPSDGDFSELVAELTALLRMPEGTMTLRPVQALALHDIGVYGGGFLPVGVGEGKTLIFALAAYLLDAKQVLALLPASLIENAERALRELAKHWLVPNYIRLMSYDMLGRYQYEHEIEKFKPEAIICDEVHRLKNQRAAVTRRVGRWMDAHPETAFVGMSGTIMSKGLNDFAHIIRWALKGRTPLPRLQHELDDWASALDELRPGKPGLEPITQLEPGALLQFCGPDEAGLDPLTAARRGFRRRLTETPGVVATAGDGERVDCSIYLRAKVYDVEPITNTHFTTLRKLWERPDGKQFEMGAEVYACARQIAAGFHYEWSPPPPDEWMAARKAWSSYVRGILSRSLTLDSPEVVVRAIDAGKIADEAGVLERWRAVKGTFKPKTIAVWHDESVLELCAEWGKSPGIIWTEHGFFGRRLAKETGLPYFGPKGLDARGVYIEDSTSKTIIASIDANRDGKNLQHKWSRNLIVSPPEGAMDWQQVIARTHRPFQKADEVIVDVLFGCREHVSSWQKAMASTYAIRDTVGGTPKLLLADVDPAFEALDGCFGVRW